MKWETRVGLYISWSLTRKIGNSSSISTKGIQCRSFIQVMEEVKQKGQRGGSEGEVAPRLAPAGQLFFLEAGGRRWAGDVTPAQGPGPLWKRELGPWREHHLMQRAREEMLWYPYSLHPPSPSPYTPTDLGSVSPIVPNPAGSCQGQLRRLWNGQARSIPVTDIQWEWKVRRVL